MAHIAERLKSPRGRRMSLLAGGLAVLLALWWWFPRGGMPSPTGGTEQSQRVERRPFTASVGFTGTIMAGDATAIAAPFDGTVKAVGFSYGDHVVPGQMLVELDLSELQQSLYDAEGNFLKAAQASADMANWESGPDVSRARRAVATAEYELRDGDRKIAETKLLFDKGLVARTEYEGLMQQRRSQLAGVVTAQEDLKSTLARGQGVNRRVSELEFANAKARYARIKAQFDAAVVRASDAGIMVRPPAGKGDMEDAGVRVGTHLSKGQLIGSVARAGGLAVAFRIDEVDVNRLRPGMPVMVTGPGFGGGTLTGKVSSVAGEAVGGAAGATPGKASFTAVARLDPLAADQARQVRIGMTANIQIVIYTNPSAIVVAPEAVQGAAPNATVSVRDHPGGPIRAATVQVGRLNAQGVEILSGLKPGETVVWTLPPAQPVAPAP